MKGRIMRLHGLLCGGLLALFGCADAKYAPVSGTVRMDGKPLANVAVSFQPLGGGLNPGPGSGGRTDAQGEYHLTVIGGGNGAVAGKHRVKIAPVVEGNPDDDRRPPPKVTIPKKYNWSSTLTFEVKPGPNMADFDLSSK